MLVAILLIILVAWIIHLIGGGTLNLHLGHFIFRIGVTQADPAQLRPAPGRADKTGSAAPASALTMTGAAQNRPISIRDAELPTDLIDIHIRLGS